MDKLKYFRIIKSYFESCLNIKVEVFFSSEDNSYRIGFNDFTIDNDNWAYIVYPYHDKFLKWTWETTEIDELSEIGNSYNNFYDCIEGIIKSHLQNNLSIVKTMIVTDFFDNEEENFFN